MQNKVGLLTFHDTNNFGSWLQTYGLYKKISELGINVEIIDYQCEEIVKREKLTWNKIIEFLRQNDLFTYQFLWRTIKKQVWFYIYTERYLKKSRKKYNRRNIKETNLLYNIFLIGSDLVWDTRITNKDFTYMLDFVDKSKRKLSYAASIGYEEIPESQRDTYKKLLKRFFYITVREESAKVLLQDLVDPSVSVVSDPTLLLSKLEWLTFIDKKNKYGDYVLVYFIDNKNEILRLAKQYARKYKYQVLIISESRISNEHCVAPINVSGFLSLIFYAKKVFTASYHGILFSLYFEKQLAFINREPKERMHSIAKKFEIESFEIHNSSFDIERELYYERITPIVKKFREESIRKLRVMIGEDT